MKTHILTFSLLMVFGALFASPGDAASSLFSNYGQIQNVPGYSSNPFWTPNSPYNTGFPRPVYATGTDLKTDDCKTVVQSLVAVQCIARNNCINTKLAEIRPEIMVQLSKLPNHNYVTACAGFIDGIFDEYVATYGGNAPTYATAFPNATIPNPNLNNTGIQIENPYKQKVPQYQAEINARANELATLQRQNGGDSAHLTATSFPTTYADATFQQRVANEMAGLEPYKDLKAYKELNVKTTSEWCEDHPNTSGCSPTAHDNNVANSHGSNNGDSNNQQGGANDVNVPEDLLIAARILKRHMFNAWTDGKTGTSGRGCFAICDKDPLTDNLNAKALYPVLKKSFCADSAQNGLLVEASTKKPLQMTNAEFNDVKKKITAIVMDQDDCDGHFRNHILYIGYLQPETSEFVKTGEIYLDD